MKDARRYEEVLHRVLDYAESEGYAGWNKFDALNSPVLERLSFGSKWLRFGYTQAVMRSPLNVRPLLLVPKTINPKGMALFAMAHLNDFSRTGSESARRRAEFCLDWLYSKRVECVHGFGWGYNFDWQSTLFFAPKYDPNAIVTCLCGEAFIKAFEVLKEEKYLQIAKKASLFLRYDLPVLHESADELCVAYVPHPVKSVVLNINASAGSQIAKTAAILADSKLLRDAKRLITFVTNRRTEYYAWYYTWPAGNSYIVHDNYHTGGIVDALRDYEVYSGDASFQDVYRQGLAYYEKALFLADGAPKFMNNAVYPFDIHGSAQGIISFAKAAYFDADHLDTANRIADWAVKNMFDETRGYFYYQKGRLVTKRFTLMRWCNAWMAKGLSDLLLAHEALDGGASSNTRRY